MARLLLINNDSNVLKQIEEALGIHHELKNISSVSAATALQTTTSTPVTPATNTEKSPSRPAPPSPLAESNANADNKLGHETEHELFVEYDAKQLEELLNTKAFDIILVDQSMIKGAPLVWLTQFRKKISLPQNQNNKIAILSFEENIETVRKFMIKGGFEDFIVLPIDAPIFREKVSLMVSKKGSYKKEIYSMPVNEPVRVAYNFEIEDLGEFGLTLKSNKKYEINDFISFFSNPFNRDGSSEIIGKCYYSEKHPSSPDLFQSKFVFVGNGPGFKKQVRTWMKTEYVRKKQAA